MLTCRSKQFSWPHTHNRQVDSELGIQHQSHRDQDTPPDQSQSGIWTAQQMRLENTAKKLSKKNMNRSELGNQSIMEQKDWIEDVVLYSGRHEW